MKRLAALAAALLFAAAPAHSDFAPPPPAPEVEREYYIMDAATLRQFRELIARVNAQLQAQRGEIERLRALAEKGGCT